MPVELREYYSAYIHILYVIEEIENLRGYQQDISFIKKIVSKKQYKQSQSNIDILQR